MSDFAPRPNLAALPTELIWHIFPREVNLDVTLFDYVEGEEVADLRALSQTCRRLRELVLPLVWAQVEIWTVRKLGLLRELLKEVPSLALLIRSFRILWSMGGDCTEARLEAFEDEIGTVLDLAFRNRIKIFNRVMKYRDAFAEPKSRHVVIEGCPAEPPGYGHDWKAIARFGPQNYDWQNCRGGVGPDGRGEDKLIKDGKQLIDCVTEVVRSLTSLETFGWETPVTPMPSGVFDALVQLDKLTDLRLVFSSYRGNSTTLPLWELAGNLRTLYIRQEEPDLDSTDDLYADDDYDEDEGAIEVIEKHPLGIAVYMDLAEYDEKEAAEAMHFSIAERTIIAAAQGGQLKRLCPETTFDAYYAKIPALLPCWANIEEWGSNKARRASEWSGAPPLFRYFLAHASHRQDWLAVVSSSDADSDRRLSQQDLQELQSYYKNVDGFPQPWQYKPIFERYLPWLLVDSELAQKVLDAWNAIVDRGEANKVQCLCMMCENVS